MQFNVLCRELACGARIWRELLAGIPESEAHTKPNPQSWSILEVACHLLDEEREDFRQRLDIILHRPAEQWPPIDPAGGVPARRYSEQNFSEVVAAFLAEREKSLAWLQTLAAPNLDAECPTPWGTMKAGDMLASWVAHDNLHMRQIVELRRDRIIEIAGPYGVMYAGDW